MTCSGSCMLSRTARHTATSPRSPCWYNLKINHQDSWFRTKPLNPLVSEIFGLKHLTGTFFEITGSCFNQIACNGERTDTTLTFASSRLLSFTTCRTAARILGPIRINWTFFSISPHKISLPGCFLIHDLDWTWPFWIVISVYAWGWAKLVLIEQSDV